MVNLSSTSSGKQEPSLKDIIGDVSSLQLGPKGIELEDESAVSVFGSKFAGNDLPRREMPEGDMPKEVAYRMIK